jgi:hypothetical protein
MKAAIFRPCCFSKSLRESLRRFTLIMPRQWQFVSRQRKPLQPKNRLSFSFHPWEWLRRTFLDPQRGQTIVSRTKYHLLEAKKIRDYINLSPNHTSLGRLYYNLVRKSKTAKVSQPRCRQQVDAIEKITGYFYLSFEAGRCGVIS